MYETEPHETQARLDALLADLDETDPLRLYEALTREQYALDRLVSAIKGKRGQCLEALCEDRTSDEVAGIVSLGSGPRVRKLIGAARAARRT